MTRLGDFTDFSRIDNALLMIARSRRCKLGAQRFDHRPGGWEAHLFDSSELCSSRPASQINCDRMVILKILQFRSMTICVTTITGR
jgi:hypothetical protein